MKKFNTSFSGYSKKEVNKFVDEVVNEYESILNKLKISIEKSNLLEQEIVKYKNLESSLNRAILIAEESGDKLKRIAIEESRMLIDDAKRNASKIVNNALIKADKINDETEILKRKVTIFKKRFRNLVEDHLEEIEKFDDFL